MRKHTYIIANNKLQHYTILQTHMTREEVWSTCNKDVDVVIEQPDIQHAQKLMAGREHVLVDKSFLTTL